MKKAVIKDFNLIDLDRGDIVSGLSMVVVNGCVREFTTAAVGGESASLRGGFVLPGLVDAHVHLVREGPSDPNRVMVTEPVTMTAYRAARSARRNLAGGVTMVRDVGGPHGIPLALAKAIENGIVPGSHVHAAGAPIAQTGGHVYTMAREADGPDEIRKAVREQIKAGAKFIKLMGSGGAYTEGEAITHTQLTAEEIRVAVEEAAAAGRKVGVHALPPKAIQTCLEAGVHSIEHAALLSEENVSGLKRSGAFMVPTLAPYYVMAVWGLETGVPDYAVAKSKQVMEHYLGSLKKAIASGINVAMGTDSGSPNLPHPTMPYEAWLWNQRAGIEPLAVLRAATLVSARALCRDQEAGSLKPGSNADFVVYKTNPLEDVSTLHRPRAVFKGGEKVADASEIWSVSLIKKGGTL
jgi:imidazolonepropionase-like amidohydrolase